MSQLRSNAAGELSCGMHEYAYALCKLLSLRGTVCYSLRSTMQNISSQSPFAFVFDYIFYVASWCVGSHGLWYPAAVQSADEIFPDGSIAACG